MKCNGNESCESMRERGNYFLVLLACFAMAQNVGQESKTQKKKIYSERDFSSSDNNSLPAARCVWVALKQPLQSLWSASETSHHRIKRVKKERRFDGDESRRARGCEAAVAIVVISLLRAPYPTVFSFHYANSIITYLHKWCEFLFAFIIVKCHELSNIIEWAERGECCHYSCNGDFERERKKYSFEPSTLWRDEDDTTDREYRCTHT